jgi:hypothetical protein
MCGEPHARVRELRFDESREQTEQEEEHPVPGEPALGVIHVCLRLSHMLKIDQTGHTSQDNQPLDRVID